MVSRVTGPVFRVGDAFPATDGPQAAIAALLVATQPLVVVARLQHLMDRVEPDERSAVREESSLFLLVQSIGAAHEALGAFRRADERGCFTEVLAKGDLETNARYHRLKASADPAGWLCSALEEGRNNISYHVDLSEVRAALKKLKNAELPAMIGSEDRATATTAIPLATNIATTAMKRRMRDWRKLVAEHLPALQSDLWHLAQAAYAVAVASGLPQP
jgi:hypothetical protein